MTDTGPCFYCPDLPEAGEKADLAEEETHHASAARRIRVGDTIGLIDGAGTRAAAVVEVVARRRLRFTVQERFLVPRPQPSVVVASAIPKGERFRVLIDMLSQVGVVGVMPLVCERGAAKPRSSAVERWQRIAIEACKQSRNPHVPVIHAPCSVTDSLATVPANGTVVFADVDGRPAADGLPESGDLFLYVGPEGGFSDAEKNLLHDRGARALNLGANILRVETAAVAAAVRCLMP